MKILHLYDGHERVYPEEGSVPSAVYQMAKYTASLGHDVTVLERRWRGSSYEEFIEGIRFCRIDLTICSNISNQEIVYNQIKSPLGIFKLILDRVFFAKKANNFLKKNQFDVIHVHLPFASNFLLYLNPKIRKKMVYTAHIGEEKKRLNLDSSTPLILKLFSPDLHLIKRTPKTVVLNESLKSSLIKKGVAEKSLEVIPIGIDIGTFSPSSEFVDRIRKKYNLHRRVILFSGTVTPRKGVEYLVKAADILKDHTIQFLIVGNTTLDKEYAENLVNYVKENQLNVLFTGFIPYEDLVALYSICDIFVLPSLEEGDPVSLKEAMVSGKPIIGSNIGGIPLQIKDGWNGFLINTTNDNQLAQKIKYLIDHPEERMRMGNNSKALAKEFDWNIVILKYMEIYMGIVQ